MKKSLLAALTAIVVGAPLVLVSTAAEAKPVKKHHHVKKHKAAKHHRVAAPQQ